jgi:hypothetical protein
LALTGGAAHPRIQAETVRKNAAFEKRAELGSQNTLGCCARKRKKIVNEN